MSEPKNIEFEDVKKAVKNLSKMSQLNYSPDSVAAKDSVIDSLVKTTATFVSHQTVKDAEAPQQLSNHSRQALRDLKAAIARVRCENNVGGDEAL